jgi:hypothetical protein
MPFNYTSVVLNYFGFLIFENWKKEILKNGTFEKRKILKNGGYGKREILENG